MNRVSHDVRRQASRRDPKREVIWRQTLARWQRSGLSVGQFCAAGRLKASVFYYWRAKLARRDAEHDGVGPSSTLRGLKPGGRRPEAGFVELKSAVAWTAPAAAPLELVLGEDRRLLIRSGCDRRLLEDVLAALEAAGQRVEGRSC